MPLLLFLASEAIFFACLIAAYVYYTGSSPRRAECSQGARPGEDGLLHGVPARAAASPSTWRNGRSAGESAAWPRGWERPCCLGAVFLYGEMQEYRKLLHENVTVSRDLFGSTYYTLTGFHALHVTVGLVLLGTILVISRRRSDRQTTAGGAANASPPTGTLSMLSGLRSFRWCIYGPHDDDSMTTTKLCSRRVGLRPIRLRRLRTDDCSLLLEGEGCNAPQDVFRARHPGPLYCSRVADRCARR